MYSTAGLLFISAKTQRHETAGKPVSYLQRLLPWVTPGCCEDNKEFCVCVVTRISSAQLTSTELVSSSEQLQRRSVHLYISNSLLLLLRAYSFPAWRRWVSSRKSVYATRSIGERSGRGGRGPHLETSGLGLEGGVEVSGFIVSCDEGRRWSANDRIYCSLRKFRRHKATEVITCINRKLSDFLHSAAISQLWGESPSYSNTVHINFRPEMLILTDEYFKFLISD